jgi:hypothetical protein
MQVDTSRESLKWKALDRWENEGGRAPAEGKELFPDGSSDNAREPSLVAHRPSKSNHILNGKQVGNYLNISGKGSPLRRYWARN